MLQIFKAEPGMDFRTGKRIKSAGIVPKAVYFVSVIFRVWTKPPD